jgi:glucose-1-phosphate cytidylyltransferase
MKTIILAGGFGTRISEYTHLIPKPMIPIGGIPVIVHLMNIYAKYNFNDFGIALGYKSEVIKDYFLKYHHIKSDFNINLKTGVIKTLTKASEDWNVTLKNTGLHTMTGGRVKRMKDYINGEPFFLTYGDGLCDVNIEELLNFHNQSKKLVTVTSVRPLARFGEMIIKGNEVQSFKEKPQTDKGWINGGFFVCNPEFLDFIEGDNTVLEKEPLEKLVELNELAAFKHHGFWQCMDNKRDNDLLNEMYDKNDTPWLEI